MNLCTSRKEYVTKVVESPVQLDLTLQSCEHGAAIDVVDKNTGNKIVTLRSNGVIYIHCNDFAQECGFKSVDFSHASMLGIELPEVVTC